jgi:hypothetical protein
METRPEDEFVRAANSDKKKKSSRKRALSAAERKLLRYIRRHNRTARPIKWAYRNAGSSHTTHFRYHRYTLLL